MPKPLFRWTVGGCIRQGLEILEESVFRTMKALGQNNFDWMICYNDLDKEALDFLEYIVQRRPIELVEQRWADCPIPDVCWSPNVDGRIEVDGKKCGGTMWKVCPARMRLNAHEIVMDNDLVLLRKPPVLDEFLSSNKTLVLEEPIRFYGKENGSPYDDLIPQGENLNSGLMGYPPGYNFGEEILNVWEDTGRFKKHSQADEQGLLMVTLRSHPNLRVTAREIKEPIAKAEPKIVGDEYGIHFVQSNRSNNHRTWLAYREAIMQQITML
jgi:hypothetical protein